MKKFIIVLFLMLSSQVVLASWTHEPASANFLDINNLQFTNRAECARESLRPSKSFFLLVDSLNIGKVLYRVGDRLGKSEDFSVQGVHRYRYTVFTLAKLVASKLLKKELPLLTPKIEGLTIAQEACASGDCTDFNILIEKLWNSTSVPEDKLMLQSKAYPTCHSLKNFSSLEAQLYVTKPNLEALEQIGQAVHKKNELLIPCDQIFQNEDLKVGVYQIDLRELEESEWLAKGFKFWNSYKIYLSWAFRNSKESKILGANYYNLIRQIDFEESVLIFPNGCRSLIAPECGKDFLNMASLRTLATAQGNPELSKLDYFDTLPKETVDDLRDSNKPSVNNDVLNLGDYDKAADWANNYRENLVKTRGFFKLKLSRASSLLNIIHASLGDSLIHKLTEYINSPASDLQDIEREEVYLLCSEFKVALEEQTSFLREDLNKLISDKDLLRSTKLISEKSLEQLNWVLGRLAPEILNLCNSLQERNFWKNSKRPANEFFAPWYQETVFNFKKNSFDLKLAPNHLGKPLLALKGLNKEVICETPAHCGRRILDALIDLKAFATFASGLLDFEDSLKSPALLNPMAERVACRTYDPWFKSKKTMIDLLQDIVLAAASTFVPTPIYVDVSLKEKKVMIFQEAIKDGKVYYDPKFDKQKVQTTLVADFGPLLGTPCAIAVSNEQKTNFSYLAFEGITVNACVGGERNTLNVYGPNEIEPEQSKGSGCFSCTINLTSVTSSALSYAPGVRPIVFLVRGVVRLVQNLRDPNDIPRSWEVDPNQVYRSWRRLGSIYSSCKNNLIKNKECMANQCEAKIVSSFENSFKKYVSKIDIYLGGVTEITVKGETKKYGIDTPRFGCSLRDIKQKDFHVIEEI